MEIEKDCETCRYRYCCLTNSWGKGDKYFRVFCPYCNSHIFNLLKLVVKPKNEVRAKDFHPAKPCIAEPKDGNLMLCPECGKNFFRAGLDIR